MLTVILVGPELAVNVGFAARAMACFGIGELRIVGSPGIATDGAARKTGKSALEILEAARYFPSLDLAAADCGSAYGFTRRARDPAQRIEDLAFSAAAWRAAPGNRPSALVFGRESHGLTKEETLMLTHLVRIPMPSGTLSLNLSHAVAIALYAFVGEGMPTPPADPGESPTRGRDAATLELVLRRLESTGFFKGGKREAQREHVRMLWQRLRPDARELDFITGLLKSLAPRD